MSHEFYLQEARAAGSRLGSQLGDELARELGLSESPADAIAAVKSKALVTIAEAPTHPYSDEEAAQAWRDTARSECLARVKVAANLARR